MNREQLRELIRSQHPVTRTHFLTGERMQGYLRGMTLHGHPIFVQRQDSDSPGVICNPSEISSSVIAGLSDHVNGDVGKSE